MEQLTDFQKEILAGIPDILPPAKPYDPTVNHAPKRKDILTPEQKKLALRNALRYFRPEQHAELIPEFLHELKHTDASICIAYVRTTRCMPAQSTNILTNLVRRLP